jgi:hypothetical protein
MLSGRTSASGAAVLAGGKVLVVGLSAAGVAVDEAQRYDPSSDVWTSVWGDSSAGYRYNFYGVVALKDGRGLAMCGCDSGTGPLPGKIYDPRSNLWIPIPATIDPLLGGFSMTVLDNGAVLVAGGWKKGGMASAEVFQP